MNSSKKHFKEKEWVTSTRMGTAGSLEPGPTERPRHREHMKNKHCSGTLGSGSDEGRPRDRCKHNRDLGAQKGSSRLPDQVEDRSGSRHGHENGQTEPKRKREKRDEASEAANGSKASSGGGSSLSIKDTNKLRAQLGLGPLQVMAGQEKAPEIQDSRSQKDQGSRRENSELRWASDSEEELHRRKSKKYRTSERDHGSPRKLGAKSWESSLTHSGSELKRGHKRRHDCTSPTSGSSTSPFSQSPQESLDKKLSILEQQRLKKEKKQQKLLRKAFETPEEKRARRLAKKEAKERKKREKMGWGEECMGYTDTNNPFGDNNLLRTFVWHKALEKKGLNHLEEKELKERNKRIQEENRLELQKVKQLCLEREREKAKQQQELERLQREKEAEHFKPWQEQEDDFHLQQWKLRSQIRIRDGRAKPIDLLARYINAEDNDLAVQIHEPYTFLNGLTVSDLKDLLEDIQVYMELEQGKNGDFWRDMTIIAEDEISKLHKLEASEKGEGKHREAVNASVSSDVQLVFKGKTYNQLWEIFQGIESKIQREGPNLDTGFWESVLQQLRVHMARSRLREDHQDVLQKTLLSAPCWYKLLFPILNKEPQEQGHLPLQARPSTSGASEEPEAEGEARAEGKGEWEEEAVPMEEDLIHQSLEDYDADRYSPRLLTTQELPSGAHVTGSEEDVRCLLLSRQQLQGTGDASESAEDKFLRQAKEGMGADESQFSVEMPLTGKAYLWADKYRPRKPRFFNRVHTGFEWNKYNRTHYDFDNPPPKIVQGYKFNIFYPDLIEKCSTPKYSLEACQDKAFAILYFQAGPPYEEIAFKIINREWEYSQRHGFRCQFVNGIFQLWFHFKRYRYRR